jgi:IS5 family transposase
LGLPIDFRITAGQVHDSTQAVDLLGQRKTTGVIADKGYDSQQILDHIVKSIL